MTTETPFALAKKLAANLSGWNHGEDCNKDGHAECCADPAEATGWWCEQGDPREDCEGRVCECGIAKAQGQAAALVAALTPPVWPA